MNTSYPRKFADLLAAFATSPRDIAPWLRALPAWGRSPAELELPWFSFGAIRHLLRKTQPTHRVFEFGSGGSSFFFARHAAHVTCIESDPRWHDRVVTLARSRQVTNLDCILQPLTEEQAPQFRGHPFFNAVKNSQWDVVVIDCMCGHQTDGAYGLLRPHAFELALPQVAPGGLLVLDDSWMFPALMEPRAGWTIRDFRGIGPCRYGVTSTAILERCA